jgi:hypothetical protein
MTLRVADVEHVMTPINGGWRLSTVATTCHVDILRMAFGNFRVVLTSMEDGPYVRGWCYQRPLQEVVLLALAFNPDAGEEPLGWLKESGTERRACGWKYPAGPHMGYFPTCPQCG